MGKITEKDEDGVDIMRAPDILGNLHSEEFVELFHRRGGIASYFSVLKSCKKSKRKNQNVSPKIDIAKTNLDQLRSRIRELLNGMCGMFNIITLIRKNLK